MNTTPSIEETTFNNRVTAMVYFTGDEQKAMMALIDQHADETQPTVKRNLALNKFTNKSIGKIREKYERDGEERINYIGKLYTEYHGKNITEPWAEFVERRVEEFSAQQKTAFEKKTNDVKAMLREQMANTE